VIGSGQQLLQVPTSVAAVQQLPPEEGNLQLEDNANRDTASHATTLLVEDFHCSIFRFTFNFIGIFKLLCTTLLAITNMKIS